jgi:hypothetical protein
MASKLRFRLVIKLFHILPAEASIDHQEGLSLVHQTHHHYLILLGIGEFQRILRSLDIEGKDFQLRHSSLARCRLEGRDHLVLYLHLEPLARSQTSIDADPGVERHVELADARDEICHIPCVSRLCASVEGIVIIVVTFPPLVQQSLQGILSIS